MCPSFSVITQIIFYSKYRDSSVLRNSTESLPDYTASRTRRQNSSKCLPLISGKKIYSLERKGVKYTNSSKQSAETEASGVITV
jgi:hypothetical protein